MARRTRNWYEYVADDHGAQFPSYNFGVLIPDDETLGGARGWALATGTVETVPQRMKLRHVIGRDAIGNTGRAICALASSDLYSGVATTFDINGVTYTVTGYVGEKRTVPAPRA